MARRQASPRATPPALPELQWLRRREVWGAILGLVGLLSALALLSIVRGAAGRMLVGFWRGNLGWGAYPIVGLLLAASAWLLAGGRLAGRVTLQPTQILGIELLLVGALGLTHIRHGTVEGYQLAAAGGGGGYLGWAIAYLLAGTVGPIPGTLLLALLAIASAGLACDVSPYTLVAVVVDGLSSLERRLAPPVDTARRQEPTAQPTSPTPTITPDPRPAAPDSPRPAPAPVAPAPRPRRRARSPHLPPLNLLTPASTVGEDDAEMRYHAQVIEETLANFGVPAKVMEVQRGPAVTLYGLEPGFIERKTAGGTTVQRKVRVNRIAALASDLALALAVPSLRIEAPLPGRPLVGIEVPNREATLVNLRSVLESDAYRRIRSPLRVALGQGVSGRPAAADLAAMPHLLIAGATGAGKSVCINALIACLLMENQPEELNLILIDPKRVELTNYNGIPHLVAPVIVEVQETVGALRWLCQEMDRRYQEFARLKVRHIEGYNAAIGRRKGQRLPYLVVFVDELADLMMVAPDDVERSLCRLAQMGRATGVHLVVATQRPSVDVVTGLIKANFPARIAFAVSTQVDSRVILDAAGAEQLLGRGDMLFMSPEANHLLRLQGCFVSDAELAAIVGYWRQATEEPSEEEMGAEAPWEGLLMAEDEEDDLYHEALHLIRAQKQASASYLQRRLRIGYSRAARLIARLEEEGIVGPDPGGGRPRPVLTAIGDAENPGEPADEERA